MLDILMLVGAGLVPAAPVYFVSKHLFDKHMNVGPSALKPSSKKLALTSKSSKKPAGPSLATRNKDKWENKQHNSAFLRDGKKVLIALETFASASLTPEALHNLDVLSDQTDRLMTTYLDTPDSIKEIPAVQQEMKEQLAQIVVGLESIKVQGQENLLRELKSGTSFLKMKFSPNKELAIDSEVRS